MNGDRRRDPTCPVRGRSPDQTKVSGPESEPNVASSKLLCRSSVDLGCVAREAVLTSGPGLLVSRALHKKRPFAQELGRLHQTSLRRQWWRVVLLPSETTC